MAKYRGRLKTWPARCTDARQSPDETLLLPLCLRLLLQSHHGL